MADLEDVPKEVRDTLEFVAVSKMDEVLANGLEDPSRIQLGAAALEKVSERAAAGSPPVVSGGAQA